MNTQIQDGKPTLEWLYARGWTLRSAAEELGVDPGHLSRVLNGVRNSKRLSTRLLSLKKKKLILRRKKNPQPTK